MEKNGDVGGGAVVAHVAQHEAFLHCGGRSVEEVGGSEDAFSAGVAYPAVASDKDREAVGEIGAFVMLEPEAQGGEQDEQQRRCNVEEPFVAATSVGTDGVEVIEIELL